MKPNTSKEKRMGLGLAVPRLCQGRCRLLIAVSLGGIGCSPVLE